MAIKFKKGFPQTIDTYEKWWSGELDRGLFPVIITSGEADRPKPKCMPAVPPVFGCSQEMFADISISPKEIADCIDYALSALEFLGDAYPVCITDFSGPGIAAAFMGASVKSSYGNIWFFADQVKPAGDLHFEYDPENFWLNRIKDIIAEGKKLWGNEVVISMPDLGGVMDIIASFRGTEGLLLDLYDEPGEAVRLVNEVRALWFRYYNEIREVIGSDRPYTDWGCILGTKSSYMFQSDFSYMLGVDMFDRFVLPELAQSFGTVERGCYHLDGTGQIKHLDSLLRTDSLKLIQWVPGAGTAPVNYWIDIYSKILDGGKLLQVCDWPLDSNIEQLDKIIKRRGSLKGVVNVKHVTDKSHRDEAIKYLSDKGAI